MRVRRCENAKGRKCEGTKVAIALAGSLAIHILLAAAVAVYTDWAPGPTVTAELDLSSVELSFAEKEDETAAVAPSLPAPAQVQPKPQAEKPPDVKIEKPLPPDPAAPKLREPEEAPRPVSTPQDIRRKTLDARDQETSPVAPRQAKVDAPPKPRRAIRPEYPKGARQRGEQGTVVLEIEVGADGSCAAVKVVVSSGFAELDAAAVRAARSAWFRPAVSDGRAVASTAQLSLVFRLK